MTTCHRELLRDIRTFPSLIKYLREELDWPIQSDDFEELTFDYTAEELGIDSKNAAKIQEIKRLRPLSVNQPWGIFFIKFEPKRLPVVALRRILSRVVIKKRASTNSAERAVWEIDDIMFVSNFGEGEERKISLAHFSQDVSKNDLPTLKVLGWDNLDTALHLDHIAGVMHANLTWPEDESDVVRWQQTWRSAFTLRHREVITTSKTLAVKLAELARAIRDRISTVLAIETEDGPITKLMAAFKEALVHDLDEDSFADMYAQTITYGLLSARVTNPTANTADDLAVAMPITNPFLKELMETFLDVGGRKGKSGSGTGLDFDELGVSEVVELLDAAKMEDVVRDFGDRNPQEDPVIHFYELFLKEYDAKKRMQRGVFYTPRPVVSFIVRSVDELLRTEFGLVDGLADTTTWGEMAERHEDLEIPEYVSPSQAFVQVLDPATGTGTFLVEAISLIYMTMTEKWKAEGHSEKKIQLLWNDYVPMGLLPRIHGYELLMAPYAIAHMKIGLKLFETGYRFGSNERVRIYLTNALEPPQDFTDRLAFAIPALAHESEAVNEIKRHKCFTVVTGNPPYSDSVTENPWIMNLVEDFKKDLGEQKTDLNREEWKFLRAVREFGHGHCPHIGGFVINNAFLRAITHRQMRRDLLSHYARIDILNLHGSSRPPEHVPTEIQKLEAISELDQNVFEIMQGVTISLFSCLSNDPGVNYAELWGKSDRKLYILTTLTSAEMSKKRIKPSDPYYFLIERDNSLDVEYLSWPSLTCLLESHTSGIQTGRDAFTSTITESEMIRRVQTIAAKRDWAQIAPGVAMPSWSGFSLADLSNEPRLEEYIDQWLCSPFDVRPLLLHSSAIKRTRMPAMSAMQGGQFGLCTVRQVFAGSWRHVFVSQSPISDTCVSNKSREYSYVFPIAGCQRDEGSLLGLADTCQSKSNLSPLAREFGLKTLNKSRHELGSAFIHYAYAVLHSKAYRTRYEEQLRIDFPRIPLTDDRALASGLASLGAELVSLHLMESSKLHESITTVVGSGEFRVEKVSCSEMTVWLDKAKTKGYRGVPEEVWNFHIGGYQVCEKWLKDRQAKGGKKPRPGRILTEEDIAHYQKIVVAINETIRIMSEIDEVIDKHGGWPDAFSSSENN